MLVVEAAASPRQRRVGVMRRSITALWILAIPATLTLTLTLTGASSLGCAGPVQSAPSTGAIESTSTPIAETTDAGAADAVDGSMSPAESTPRPDEIRGLLRPWQQVEEEWLERSRYIVVARYHRGRYPCQSLGRGRHRTLLRQAFEIERQLRGFIPRPDFEVSLIDTHESAFPGRLIDGRRYLVLLAPGASAEQWLLDPSHVFNVRARLWSTDLVALIDLEATEQEVALRRADVARWSDWEGSTFSVPRWQELRRATTVDLHEVGRAMHLIRRQVIDDSSTRAQLRQQIGPPDRQAQSGAIDIYELSLAVGRSGPVDGTLLGRIELEYAPTTWALRAYSERFDIVDDGETREATAEEIREQGLTLYEVNFSHIHGH